VSLGQPALARLGLPLIDAGMKNLCSGPFDFASSLLTLVNVARSCVWLSPAGKVDRAVPCSMLIWAAKPHLFNIARGSGRSTCQRPREVEEPNSRNRRPASKCELLKYAFAVTS
jgi:hypothetical protein